MTEKLSLDANTEGVSRVMTLPGHSLYEKQPHWGQQHPS